MAKISGDESEERYLKIVEDITEAKTAEQALEEERRTLETLIRTSGKPGGWWLCRTASSKTFWS